MTTLTIRLVAATLAFAAATATFGGVDRLAKHVVNQASAATTLAQTAPPVQRIEIIGKRLPA